MLKNSMKRFLILGMFIPILGSAQTLENDKGGTYKDGWKLGWAAAYQSVGRAATTPPAHRTPPARRSGDKRSDFERGYAHALLEAYQRIEK